MPSRSYGSGFRPSSTSRSSTPLLQMMAQQRLMEIRRKRKEHSLEVARPYSPHPPSPKQRAFLELDGLEVFFGGSAGGGKSDALLHAALQYVDVPGYSALILRRTKTDLALPSSIKARADEWWMGTRAKWDAELNGYRFPTRTGEPDATIAFGYLQHEADKYRYQGAEVQFIGIDELGQWTESAYRYLFSRLRRHKRSQVPLRMRSAGNPGGVGEEWVRRRFIEHARLPSGMDVREFLRRRKAGLELPYPPVFRSPPSQEAVALAREFGRKAEGSVFLPAFAEDNPGLDLEEYRLSLVQLDPMERAQLEDGDWWAIRSGKFFKPEWFQYVDRPPEGLSWVRYWDLAGTRARQGKDPDWSAGFKVGVHRLPTGARAVYIAHGIRAREDPGGVENLVRGVAEADGKGVPIYIEEEPGSSGKNNTHNYASRVLFGWQVYGHRKTGPKEEYWKPLSAAARNGLVHLVRGAWNAEFVQELCGLPQVPHDDQADAASGGFSVLVGDNELDRARMLAGLG
jgi:predicted phage terminase large subunit-like protein